MKLFCSVCLEELPTTNYPGLGAYAEPCACAEEREREVAAASALFTCEQLENWFAEIVEEVHEEVNLDNQDKPEDLKELDQLLCHIVALKTEPNFEADPYDDLDI